ncbi:hypothetical protein GCM10009785_17980 [Brooklawnia cerclae]|uniref:Bacterial SCP orthologue domain-containing protein n=1 Tax=Brooklawnia cerclae TaxID=349934 RepID=A0ABX0SI33_9ACTN|nr:sterol carrier family protein [Brooklawnia cerclae]NIH57631.1 hypothetical protein [Brooklawnia cerclae]
MAARANQSLRRACAAFLRQVTSLATDASPIARDGLGCLLFLTTDTLQTLGSATRGTPGTLGDHLRQRELAAEAVAERIEGFMGSDDTITLRRQLDPLVSELATAFVQTELPNTVATPLGAVRLIDYVRANTLFAVDLAIDAGSVPDPDALASAVRALATVLAERYPGQTIEVRVPPFAAVQVGAFGDGPTHTRGTPPNVVEMDPSTFFALAIGRLTWPDARSQARLTSSGAHADEAARMFPIYAMH